MERMFQDCKSLTYINLTHFNTENVTEMNYMFYGCEKLKNIDISNFTLNKDVRNVSLFSNLHNNGTLFVRKEFFEIIKSQIPLNWSIIYDL